MVMLPPTMHPDERVGRTPSNYIATRSEVHQGFSGLSHIMHSKGNIRATYTKCEQHATWTIDVCMI